GMDDDKRDTTRGDDADDQIEGPRRLLGDEEGKAGDQQRLHSARGRGDSAGHAIRGRDEEWEEDAEVEQSQQSDASPLGSARSPRRGRPADDQQSDASWQHPHQGDEQRAAARQELGDDDIRGAPRDRGENGEQHRRIDAAVQILHVRYLNIKIMNVKVTSRTMRSMTRQQTADAVDRISSQWKAVRPDLDTSPLEVIGRVSRLSRLIDRALAEN